MERRAVASLAERRVLRQQTLIGMLEIRGDRRSRSAQRWKLSGARGIGTDSSGNRDAVLRGRQAVDVVVVVLVQGERDVAAPLRHGERRRHLRDSGDAGLHVRDPRDMPVAEVVAIDIGNAFRIGDEVQALAVRREVRIEALGVTEQRQRADPTAVDVDRGDGHPGEAKLIDASLRASVADERDRLSVRGEGRLQVGEFVVRQLPNVLAVEIE